MLESLFPSWTTQQSLRLMTIYLPVYFSQSSTTECEVADVIF